MHLLIKLKILFKFIKSFRIITDCLKEECKMKYEKPEIVRIVVEERKEAAMGPESCAVAWVSCCWKDWVVVFKNLRNCIDKCRDSAKIFKGVVTVLVYFRRSTKWNTKNRRLLRLLSKKKKKPRWVQMDVRQLGQVVATKINLLMCIFLYEGGFV